MTSPTTAGCGRRTCRRRLLGALALAAGCSATLRAAAQTGSGSWPPPRIRLIVAYAVGGISSEVALALGDTLSRQLAVPVLIEHRPGAGGTLALEVLARAPADGSVIAFSAITPLTLAPLLGRVPYDAERDIAPVTAVMRTPVLIAGTPALPADGMAAMLAWAHRTPGGVRWASTGVGTTGHLVLERVVRATGITVTHVPYGGGGRPLNDALGGQFEVLSTNVAPTPVRYVRDGRLNALAVTGPGRLPGLPQVPTLGELGLAEANVVSTFGIFAPGRMPARSRDRLHAALLSALNGSGVPALLAAADNLVLSAGPEVFGELIADDRALHRRWLAGRR